MYIQIQKQASYYNFNVGHRLSTTVALNSWSSIGVMTGLLCRLSTLDGFQGICLLSLTSLFFFSFFFSALSPFTIDFESEIV